MQRRLVLLTQEFITKGYSIIESRAKAIKRINFLLECGRLDSRYNKQVRGL